MFEIDDDTRRKSVLARLGGIEDHMFMQVAGEQIRGRPEGDRENTREDDNKASPCIRPFRLHTGPEGDVPHAGRANSRWLRPPELRPPRGHAGSRARGAERGFRLRHVLVDEPLCRRLRTTSRFALSEKRNGPYGRT